MLIVNWLLCSRVNWGTIIPSPRASIPLGKCRGCLPGSCQWEAERGDLSTVETSGWVTPVRRG